ncbi:MAG: phosphopantothenoylcysteine decarboxylase [Phycisphaeraceae bacterium]|nr:phosphopantothenoylcysteine decarboxylase [Phycisphaeraceae bacterium]
MSSPPPTSSSGNPLRFLVTAGPTWEPVDEVRFLGNRSSGRLGAAIAEALAARGHRTTLLRGPATTDPAPSPHQTDLRFQTAAELEELLARHWPAHDVLIMAAAVADFRPIRQEGSPRKIRRRDGPPSIELEPVPDLLAGLASIDHPGTRIGFALEPAEDLEAAALRKLAAKTLHAIVANPLETMEADGIDGTLLHADGTSTRPGSEPVSKSAFAGWLADEVIDLHRRRITASGPPTA